ncbi:hypothetical protein C0584_03620 [Candidatus Parcubacteria bacterium]|nr:MAG: hypothetical protein C0584_03620 [Candidatus Parcubacteria bacterium]
MKKTYLTLLFIVILFLMTFIFLLPDKDKGRLSDGLEQNIDISEEIKIEEPATLIEDVEHPMSISSLRGGNYPGGDFVVEEELANGTNYKQSIVSYLSEGLKIYGLLTTPLGDVPVGGWPGVVFVHGYIPPEQYSTTGDYPTYQARLARAGFITFKPDLRGHGNSEGDPVSAHYSEKYVVDTLNAISYIKKYPEVNPGKILYWGHSNGGEIGLRVLVVSDDIKAASLWAGVVGSYKDMFETHNDKIPFLQDASSTDLILKNGLPSENPDFWDELDPFNYISDIYTPVQLQHATGDDRVPIELSLSLKNTLEDAGKEVEYIQYEGDDHNIGQNSSLAWDRTIEFFNKTLSEKSVKTLDYSIKRITKKEFGTYVDENNSPVQNERFQGYHTGVDFEVYPGEKNIEVQVESVCDGPLVYKDYVSGYGGVVIQECTIDNEKTTVLYGHLALESILKSQGDNLVKGTYLGNLGEDKSVETDGERRHLHLSVHKGEEIELAGYTSSLSSLSEWRDPCDYFCQE